MLLVLPCLLKPPASQRRADLDQKEGGENKKKAQLLIIYLLHVLLAILDIEQMRTSESYALSSSGKAVFRFGIHPS